MGLLKRTVGSKNREIFSMLCESLVISVLEYACPVWSPYSVKDKFIGYRKSTTKSIENIFGELSGKNHERCQTKNDAHG